MSIARTRSALWLVLPASLLLASPAKAIDLLETWQHARDYNPAWQAAQLEHQATLQAVPLARSAFRPQLSTGAQISSNDANTDSTGNFTATGLNLNASQSLYNRSNSAVVKQAKLAVQQSEAGLRATEQQLILDVSSAYFEVLRADAQVQFSKAELDAIAQQLRQAERRFDVGLATIIDVRDAQAQHDLANAQLVAAENQYATAGEALRVISGIDPQRLHTLADNMPLMAPAPDDIDAWVAQALEQNPALLSQRLALQIAQKEIDVQRGVRMPSLDVVATASTRNTDIDLAPHRDSGEIGLQVAMPLFSGGRIKAQVADARFRAGAAAETLREREMAVTRQTRDAWRGVRTSISRTRALQKALISTQKSAEATDAGFRAGTRTSVDVLRALRDTFSARSDYTNGRFDFLQNLLNLKAATGNLGEADLEEINGYLRPAALAQ